MKNIYIIGFMGTGKTSVAKLLAEDLGRQFVEMDALIEQSQESSIADIFARQGEAYFRRQEKELLAEISQKNDLVVSCGGGVACDQENLSRLKATGLTICLSASAKIIYQRTKKSVDRPLLKVSNPLVKIEELLAERKACYEQADFTIDTDQLSPRKVTDRIIKIIKSLNG